MKTFSVLLFIGFLFLKPGLVASQSGVEKKVKENYKQYIAAVVAADGETAVNFIDSGSVRYFQKIYDLALNADSAETVNRGVYEQFLILLARCLIQQPGNYPADGRELFISTVNSGFVKPEYNLQDELGPVTVVGDLASAYIISNGKPTQIYCHFYRQHKSWKLDITKNYNELEFFFQMAIQNAPMTEKELLKKMLQEISGCDPGPEIWHPQKN